MQEELIWNDIIHPTNQQVFDLIVGQIRMVSQLPISRYEAHVVNNGEATRYDPVYEKPDPLDHRHIWILRQPKRPVVFSQHPKVRRDDIADYFTGEGLTPRHFVLTSTMMLFSIDVLLPERPEFPIGALAIEQLLHKRGIKTTRSNNDILVNGNKVCGTLHRHESQTGVYVETPGVQLGDENSVLQALLPPEEYERPDGRVVGSLYSSVTEQTFIDFISDFKGLIGHLLQEAGRETTVAS